MEIIEPSPEALVLECRQINAGDPVARRRAGLSATFKLAQWLANPHELASHCLFGRSALVVLAVADSLKVLFGHGHVGQVLTPIREVVLALYRMISSLFDPMRTRGTSRPIPKWLSTISANDSYQYMPSPSGLTPQLECQCGSGSERRSGTS